MSAVGWDVILTGLSLGVWAGIRALDAWEMLGSSMVVFPKRTDTFVEDASEPSVKQEVESAVQR